MNPVEALGLIANVADSVFLWTHYYDEATIATQPIIAAKFSGSATNRHRGFEHTLHRYEYGAALDWGGFSGGTSLYSHWLSRADIVRCLEFLGFNDLRVNFEDPRHPNGPSFAVLARRGPR